jgi:hypothetical protein
VCDFAKFFEKKKEGKQKEAGEGSRPSPQSPKGILGFPPPDPVTQGTLQTKPKLLKSNRFVFRRPVKSPRAQ